MVNWSLLTLHLILLSECYVFAQTSFSKNVLAENLPGWKETQKQWSQLLESKFLKGVLWNEILV